MKILIISDTKPQCIKVNSINSAINIQEIILNENSNFTQNFYRDDNTNCVIVEKCLSE